MGAWGRASVWAGVDTSGETSVDAELCSCMETSVCVVDTGGTVSVVADVVAAASTDTGVAAVVDTCVVVTFVVATVMDFPGDDVVVTAGNGAGAAPAEVVTGGGILTVFSAVVVGVVEVMSSLEAAAATGVVTWTPSVGGEAVTLVVFVLAVVVTLADVGDVGEGVQIVVGAAGGFTEDVSATGTVVTGASVAT